MIQRLSDYVFDRLLRSLSTLLFRFDKMPTTPSNSKKPAKKASKSKQLLITLKISSTAFLTLARRLELPIEAKSDSVSFTGSPSPPSSESAKLKTSSQDQSPSESASTPAPTEALSVEGCLQEGGSSPSKTGSPSLKPSLKRSSTADIDKDTKNKGKPGPKKKQKL